MSTSTSTTTLQGQTITPAGWRSTITQIANAQLVELLGVDAGRAAACRVGLAFAATARTARDPSALYRCTPESVASCVAMCALTGLMPGGPIPAVWLIPRSGELQFLLSHRGIAQLCLRAGYQVLAVPVHVHDALSVAFMEVVEHTPSGSYPNALSELAGVYLTIRKLESGLVLCRPYCPRALIEARASCSPNSSIWKQWPVEMALKTAIHWALARGLLPIEGIEIVAALSAEPSVSLSPLGEDAVDTIGPNMTGPPSKLQSRPATSRDQRRGSRVAAALEGEAKPESDIYIKPIETIEDPSVESFVAG